MDKLSISVIIPIYGVEQYIERCARSLFEQTLNVGVEYIFIDDASKDKQNIQNVYITLKLSIIKIIKGSRLHEIQD